MNIIVECFEHLTDIINQANLTKVQRDQFKILVHFILSFPLAMLLRYIKTTYIRKLYITYIGLFFVLYLGAQWIGLVLIETILIYILSFLKKPFIPICITSFTILGYLHYDRYMNAEATWKMGFNVVQMMLTCRYVYFGAAVEDKLVNYNYLDYISYIFYFPNIIVGTVPFIGYVNFVNLREQYQHQNYNFNVSLKTLGKAIIFVIADQIVRPKFDFNWFASSQWLEYNLFNRHIIVQLISICARFKYFLAFKFSQAAMEASGICYQQDYSLADYRFEYEFNTLKRTKYWNSSVQTWLQTCFYDRFNKFKYALIVTFLISAYWHGFYLAYYLFFIEWALFNDITKKFYRNQEKFKIIPKKIQFILCMIYGELAVNSTSVPVGLLQWDNVIKAMHELGWVAQIMLVSLYLVLNFTKLGSIKKKKDQ